MSFFDFADLPRSHFLFDSSRKYRGLSYNCSHALPHPVSRPPPAPRAPASTSLRPTKFRTPGTSPRTTRPTMTITLSPFTQSDIPAAMAVHSSINNDSEEGRARLEQEWNLALVNPYAKVVKATHNGALIGAAGFLTHETNGLQWTSAERRAWAGSAEKELEDRLEDAREEVLQGDYDLWHVYLILLAPEYRDTSAWSDLISWGLAHADEAEKRVFAQASASEKAMYEALGFTTKTTMTLPEGDRYLMLRRA